MDYDELVALWHEGDGQGQSLAEYLGMTDQEYASWVEPTPKCHCGTSWVWLAGRNRYIPKCLCYTNAYG